MKTLLIDNYDSFTYNLFQLVAEVNGEDPIVVRNDAASWAELERLQFDNVVISPGPGRADRDGDFGVCAETIRCASAPLLGVCLGHQGLGWVHGATVAPAPEAMHGRIGAVVHDGSPLFAGMPREFQAVRYHSLCVEQPLPDELEAIAWTSDGVLMALAHRTRPQWGVQFHPESICTEHGRRLLANFGELTREQAAATGAANAARVDRVQITRQHDRPVQMDAVRRSDAAARPPAAECPNVAGRRDDAERGELSLRVERLDAPYDAERAFVELYGGHETAFWLDSSRVDERARFSFIGAADGPLAATIYYDVSGGELRIERREGVELRRESIFDYLSGELRRLRVADDELPFGFDCGFVGYFGYELKADCEGDAAHRSTMPDAAFVFADRLIAFDHAEDCTYVLCIAAAGESEQADRWIAQTSRTLAALAAPSAPERDGAVPAGPSGDGEGPLTEGLPTDRPPSFRLSRSHERYLDDVATCRQRLIEGETYEICLTNRISAELDVDPLALYRRLRRVNPAPFSAYLRFGERAVLSSSPERFLAVGRDRWVEAKPIKGTSTRGATPAEDVRLAEQLRLSEKNRAENLMIADVLRNDLGVVCEVGTVHVPELMRVESFATVHQLVSTVRGLLREDVEPPECIRACFPGGSMTGAPKKRTMEIIDELEGEARGVYSGAIGYLGLAGACDLAVVIRTIVVESQTATVGVGGAIVMQSDAEDEYEEMLLKARAPIAAIDPRVDPLTAFAATGGLEARVGC